EASGDEIADAVRSDLCGPGGAWETAVEDVIGTPSLVFVNRHRTLRDALAADTAAHAQEECLVLGDTRLTYAEVQRRVDATAARLRELGVAKGDRVGILAANCPEWVITFYATVGIGGIVAAFNGWWTEAEIDHAISLSEPTVIVGDARRLARAASIPAAITVVDIDERPDFFSADGAPHPDIEIDEDDPALILFTSGTTGRSKGALLSHRGLVGFVDGTIHNATEKKLIALTSMGIDPSAVPDTRQISLNTAPLFHISGLMAGILMHFRSGSTVVFRSGRFDPADVLRLIEQESITTWAAIGSMAPRVMDHPDVETRDLSSLMRVSSGGSHFTRHLQERIRETFPQAASSIGQGYGSSESCGVVTSIGGEEFRANPDATGRACLGVEIEIRDAEGRPVSDGVDGEVHVRSPHTMLRYWGDEAATAAVLKSGRWLAMGDIGRLEDGLLFLNSRARDMIIRSGENIYPVEIEQRLESHPSVAEVAVVGVDHVDHGQEVKAVIVAAGGRPDVDDLAAWCRETLAAYKVPTLWEHRAEPLPRNASGKVVKDVLTGERELSIHED
ncbi:MAG: class I adenylate-forming enzyme family protein, partial [Actinomycetota bacterium]